MLTPWAVLAIVVLLKLMFGKARFGEVLFSLLIIGGCVYAADHGSWEAKAIATAVAWFIMISSPVSKEASLSPVWEMVSLTAILLLIADLLINNLLNLGFPYVISMIIVSVWGWVLLLDSKSAKANL